MITAVYCAKGTTNAVCQDAYALEVVEKKWRSQVLLAVCDGIGGLDQGEYASQFVVRQIKAWFYEEGIAGKKRLLFSNWKKTMTNSCTRMLYGCHTALNQYGLHNNISLGTTMTMVVVKGRRYLLFHVGDSRAYKLGKQCICITRDDIYKHNVLKKCIGSFPWGGITIEQGRLSKGQGILLCTDGIYKAFTEQELGMAASRAGSEKQLKKCITALAKEARNRGVRDDQTGVIYLNRREGYGH